MFHALKDLGTEVSKLERTAYSTIQKETDMESRLSGSQPHQAVRNSMEAARDESSRCIRAFDTVWILFCWLKEHVGFSEYAIGQVLSLCGWMPDDMEKAVAERPSFSRAVRTFRKRFPDMLRFLDRLYRKMDEDAPSYHVTKNVFRLLYHLKTYAEDTPEHMAISRYLDRKLDNKREEAEEVLRSMIRKTKRTSSLVENLNSRIRVYMNLKKAVPKNFFALMKVYFNTRKYRRSAVKERKGKSPLELLTGKGHPCYLELLGF